MNILYIHGFGSRFDPEADKVKQLEKIGTVYGITVDYTCPEYEIFPDLLAAAIDYKVDLVVGCSMGGNMAALVSEHTKIPFVAMNPAINPQESLMSYVGQGETHYGETYFLSKEAVKSYAPMTVYGTGIVLLDDGDQVLDSAVTYNEYNHVYECTTFLGGSHRFEHTEEALSLIKDLVSKKA